MEQIEMTPVGKTMGAHFSAFIDTHKNQWPGRFAFESARSALYALLKERSPKRVHLPNFVCTALPDAVALAGAEVVKYPINRCFGLGAEIDFRPDDLVILINFFGINEASVLSDLAKLPKESVLVDCSQAYFSSAFDCMASFYSPRKFVPVADGGFIHTAVELNGQPADEQASINRFEYLLQRAIGEPEASRALYLRAEESLHEISLREMSCFSKKVIETSDLNFIRNKRVQNFKILSELDELNEIRINRGEQVPLCYPLMVKKGRKLREHLQAQRIFTPKYWPDVNPSNDFENFLLNDTVYLPIDHRYSDEDMRYLTRVVKSFIKGD